MESAVAHARIANSASSSLPSESTFLAKQIHVWAPAFDTFGGGIAAFSRELVVALQGQGHRPVLCGREDRPGEWNACELHGAGGVPQALRKMTFACKMLWLAATRRPALIISTHPNFAPVALLAKRLLGVRYVVVVHGIDIHPGLSPLRKQALRNADAVWAVSRWTRERVLHIGVAADRLRVLSNTVDSQRFDVGAPDAGLRQRHAIAPGAKVLLTVARLDPAECYKGYDAVLRALPALQASVGPVFYLIVGTGGDRVRAEQLAHDLGVADRVRFCGFVEDAELPEYYRLADAFVMPSRGEGFGIVFLEAMACGTPVLGGNRDGTVDALADGALGALVDPADDAAVASGIQRLLQGHGPSMWFQRPALRAKCVAIHGREMFSSQVAEALAALEGRVG
jgi:glycosyltransferase involved in cell wall biosynthesis